MQGSEFPKGPVLEIDASGLVEFLVPRRPSPLGSPDDWRANSSRTLNAVVNVL